MWPNVGGSSNNIVEKVEVIQWYWYPKENSNLYKELETTYGGVFEMFGNPNLTR